MYCMYRRGQNEEYLLSRSIHNTITKQIPPYAYSICTYISHDSVIHVNSQL